METTKSNPQITQELLALVNARRDRTQQPDERSAAPETDPLIKALLDELSLSGDGTPGSVDRSQPYLKTDKHDPELFRQAVTKLRDEAGELPESLEKIFAKLLQ